MADAGSVVRVHWPLYTVYPAATLAFWGSYLFVLPAACRRVKTYAKFNDFNRRCFRQNLNAVVHTLLVVGSLVATLAGDAELAASGLSPHYSTMAYVEVAVSLGYFSFALPWSLHMYYVLKARPPYTSRAFALHHATVVIGELTYLLTQYAPWYGALALALFEATNWLYLPFILLTQLGYKGSRCWLVVGAAFVLVYTGLRVGACTWLAVRFITDVASFAPGAHGAAGWVAVALSLGAFLALYLLSLYWWATQVAPQVHVALLEILGPTYYQTCVPARVLAFASKHSKGARSERRARDEQAKVLGWLRREQEEAAAASAPLGSGKSDGATTIQLSCG